MRLSRREIIFAPFGAGFRALFGLARPLFGRSETGERGSRLSLLGGEPGGARKAAQASCLAHRLSECIGSERWSGHPSSIAPWCGGCQAESRQALRRFRRFLPRIRILSSTFIFSENPRSMRCLARGCYIWPKFWENRGTLLLRLDSLSLSNLLISSVYKFRSSLRPQKNYRTQEQRAKQGCSTRLATSGVNCGLYAVGLDFLRG